MHQAAQRHKHQKVFVDVTEIELLWSQRTSKILWEHYMGQHNKHQGQEEERASADFKVLGGLRLQQNGPNTWQERVPEARNCISD